MTHAIPTDRQTQTHTHTHTHTYTDSRTHAHTQTHARTCPGEAGPQTSSPQTRQMAGSLGTAPGVGVGGFRYQGSVQGILGCVAAVAGGAPACGGRDQATLTKPNASRVN